MQKPDRTRQDYKRSLGQNFLVDQGYLSLIAQAASESGTGLEILELAAGDGNLTEYLYPYAEKIVAVEIDDRWCEKLRRRFHGRSKVTVVKADARKADWSSFGEGQNAVLVGNLPYSAAAPIMLRFWEYKNLFSSFLVLIQKEVSQRIIACPGEKEYAVLSVLLSLDFSSRLLFDVPPSAFYPAPKVVSSLVRLSPRGDRPVYNRTSFVSLVKAAFFNRRKKIINSLTASGVFPSYDKEKLMDLLDRAGIDPERRGETVTVEEFTELNRLITMNVSLPSHGRTCIIKQGL